MPVIRDNNIIIIIIKVLVLATLKEHNVIMYTDQCGSSCISRSWSRCMLCNEVQRGSMQSDHVSLIVCAVGLSMCEGILHKGDKINVSYI
jgi:hypothetical protein